MISRQARPQIVYRSSAVRRQRDVGRAAKDRLPSGATRRINSANSSEDSANVNSFGHFSRDRMGTVTTGSPQATYSNALSGKRCLLDRGRQHKRNDTDRSLPCLACHLFGRKLAKVPDVFHAADCRPSCIRRISSATKPELPIWHRPGKPPDKIVVEPEIDPALIEDNLVPPRPRTAVCAGALLLPEAQSRIRSPGAGSRRHSLPPAGSSVQPHQKPRPTNRCAGTCRPARRRNSA